MLFGRYGIELIDLDKLKLRQVGVLSAAEPKFFSFL